MTVLSSCDGTTACSCETVVTNQCISPIPNTVNCPNALPASSPTSPYQLACADPTCSTCSAVECGVQCAPNTQYDSGSDACIPFDCDESTLPDS